MKILFVIQNMKIGGVTTSLINLINLIKKNNYKDVEIDVMMLKKHGEALDLLRGVEVFEADVSMQSFGVPQQESRKYGIRFFIQRSIDALKVKLFGNKRLLAKKLSKHRFIDKEYDVAISYFATEYKSTSTGCPELVLSNINAKKKFIFIHCEFVKGGLNNPYCIDVFSKFDKILLVSKSCADDMKRCVPSLNTKIDYLYNSCDVSNIICSAEKDIIKYDDNVFNIVTVARLSKEKGVYRIINVVEELIKNNIKGFCWHIIGDGKEKSKLLKIITKKHLGEYIKFYGTKRNPFPYVKNADLFVLPSYHESFGIVIIESLSLGVPVLSTKTISAEEVIGEFGFVCENCDMEIFKKLKEIMSDQTLLFDKKKRLKKYKYNDDSIYDKFIKLIK